MGSDINNISLELLAGVPRRSYKSPFGPIVAATILLFVVAGLYLKTVKALPPRVDEKRVTVVTTQFVVPEKKKPPPPKPKPLEPDKDKQPVDLTKSPLLNQKQDFTAQPQNVPAQSKQTARPVYGLRRVFSTGLGAGGTVSEAVIGKLGNTLDKDVDTVTATPSDIKGALVSITSVSTAPRLKHDVKPEYTKEMVAAKVEGVVRAELLVDIDGKVKEVKILNDLGYGTRDRAREAFLQWEFVPAMRDGKPVATWISYSIRFVFLQG